LHYATDSSGNINYVDIRKGRRIFCPGVPQIPLGQESQGSMFDVNDLAADYREHLVNLVREQVNAWRDAGYDGLTRVSRDLLTHWFENPERPTWRKLFFAQREAIETAIG